MPTLKIDGQELTVPDGTNLVEAAKTVGVEIPTFCYHPDLSIAANCRMCLIKGRQNDRDWPKPMPACQMIAADGMEIDASSDEVKRLREVMLEFILINHPLDCPICDKAGECDLQDNYFQHSNKPSRFKEAKEEKLKRVDLGSRIVYDGERCIACTRCVRFMDEIAKDPQLGVIHRGDKVLIATASGEPLDHPYSVNVVDLCPVGALTDKEFRFQQRAWFLRATSSVCAGCARGCSTQIDVSTVDNLAYRVRPRRNDAVSGPWMCDAGRLTFQEIHGGRLEAPVLREDPGADHEKVAQAAADRLRPFLGADELAVAISATCTCEDAFAAALLAKEVLDLERVSVIGRPDWEGDDFLRTDDHNPNRRGVTEIAKALGLGLLDPEVLLDSMEEGAIKALLVVGNPWPVDDLDRVGGAITKLEASVALLTHDDAVARSVGSALPICTFAEAVGTYVNADGRVQKLEAAMSPVGKARPAWEALVALSRAAGTPLKLRSLGDLWAQLCERVPFFADVCFEELPAEGIGVQGDQ